MWSLFIQWGNMEGEDECSWHHTILGKPNDLSEAVAYLVRVASKLDWTYIRFSHKEE